MGEIRLKFIEIAWNLYKDYQEIQDDTEYFAEFYYD